MAKYHIKKDGSKAICRATVRACPRGGASQHFSTPEDCDKALDKMNEKASRNEFAIARVGNKIVISEESKKLIRDLSAAQLNIDKIENTSRKIKDTIKNVLEEMGVKKISTQYGDLSYVKSSERASVDVDKLKEDNLYDKFLKESDRRAYVAFNLNGDDDGSRRRALTKADDFEVQFSKDDIVVNDNGNVYLSNRGLELIKNLRDIDLALDEVKEKHKLMRDNLGRVMDEEGLPGIKFGGSYWERVPEMTVNIVDTQKLKDRGIYNEYSKKININSSIRTKWVR